MTFLERFEKWVLIGIIVIAAALRLPYLAHVPSGFHADEAAFGYNAYSILQTGKDEYGVSFPLILKSFGDYKGALYSYITIPFVALLGLNELSVRLPTALFGIIAVYVTYVVVGFITKKRSLALTAALLHAINPSAVFLSRVQSDPLVAGVLFLMGLYCWFIWVKKDQLVLLVMSLVLWTAASFGYITTRIFLLIFIPILILTERIYRGKKQLLLTAGVYILLIFFSIFTITGGKADRLAQVNPFTKIDVQLPLDEAIREDGVMNQRGIVTRIMHNKVSAYVRSIGRLVVSYISPEFLFFQSSQPLRERLSDTGILLLIEFPFIIAGLYFMVKNKMPWRFLLGSWTLFGIVSLSFASAESPNIHRFYILLLPIHVLSAYGIFEFAKIISTRSYRFIFYAFTLVLFCINIWMFVHELYIHQPSHAPYFRGYAYKELVQKVSLYYPLYDNIVVTKGNESPYIYFLFFGKYDPLMYQQSGSHRDLDYQGFDKYIFVPYDCPSFNGTTEKNIVLNKEHTLIIRRGNCDFGLNDKLLDSAYWYEGSEAFQLVVYQEVTGIPYEK